MRACHGGRRIWFLPYITHCLYSIGNWFKGCLITARVDILCISDRILWDAMPQMGKIAFWGGAKEGYFAII